LGLGYDLVEAVRSLAKADRILGKLMAQVGPPELTSPDRLNPFQYLIRCIIYQQLSGKAAQTIYQRVQALFPGQRTIRPEQIVKMDDSLLRGAGMSRAKTVAVNDLAEKTISRIVPSGSKLRRMEDEEIIERLVQVHGIGVWTVQMLLLFMLGRPDVLPVKDLGVRKGFMLTYKLDEMPEERELEKHAEIWKPYRSVGSWYMWRALDLFS
jgi:3-methyladenine DNA glycosylase/8-oxoguanine DNA glycosylase